MVQPLEVLSLGAGVQSSTVALMSACGRLGRLDAAIFADTGWEPKAVYRWLDYLEAEIAASLYPFPVYRVSNGNIRQDILDSVNKPWQGNGGNVKQAPFYTRTVNPDLMTGTKADVGMLWRKCTNFYKLKAIRRKVRELAVARHGGRPPAGAVRQWVGISEDEADRRKESGVQYVKNVFPLLEMRWSREDCLRWMEDRGYPSPPKSACLGCPYTSNARWRELRDTNPEEWEDVVEFDAAIRRGLPGVRGEGFVHRQAVPLPLADLRTKDERKYGMANECSGMCGV